MNGKTTKSISSESIIAIVAAALVLTPLIVFSWLSIYKVSQSLTDVIANEIEAKSILVTHDINSFINERILTPRSFPKQMYLKAKIIMLKHNTSLK